MQRFTRFHPTQGVAQFLYDSHLPCSYSYLCFVNKPCIAETPALYTIVNQTQSHRRHEVSTPQGRQQIMLTTHGTHEVRTNLVCKSHHSAIRSTKMWADAQRDGRPAEYRWPLCESSVNSIPCTTPQSLADIRCWSAVQNARLRRKVNFAPDKILSGARAPENVYTL